MGMTLDTNWSIDDYKTTTIKNGTGEIVVSRILRSFENTVSLPPFTTGDEVNFTFITNALISTAPKYKIKIWTRNSTTDEVYQLNLVEGSTTRGTGNEKNKKNCSFVYTIPNVNGIAQIFVYGGIATPNQDGIVNEVLKDLSSKDYGLTKLTTKDWKSDARIQLNRGILPEKKIIKETMTSSSGVPTSSKPTTTQPPTEPRTFYIRNNVSSGKSNIQIKLGSEIKFDGLTLEFNEVNNINLDETREALKNNIKLGFFTDAQGGDTGSFDIYSRTGIVDVYYYYDEVTRWGEGRVINDWTTIIVFDSEVTINKILDYQVIDTNGNIFNSNDTGNGDDVIKINLSGQITEVTPYPYYLKNLLKMKNVEVKGDETSSYDLSLIHI